MISAKLPQVRLQHMLENIDGVLDITAGQTISAILESFVLIRATERALQIISEAAKELPPDVRDREPGVPWKNIIGIGNLLRHEYYRLDPGGARRHPHEWVAAAACRRAATVGAVQSLSRIVLVHQRNPAQFPS